MISFSGIDCAGKSTQIELVKDYLLSKNKKVKIIHSRGGYTPCLEFFKRLIRSNKTEVKDQSEYRTQIHSNSKKRKLLLWLSILDMGLYYGIYFRFVELFGYIILADRYFVDSLIDFRMKYSEDAFESWKIWSFTSKIYMKPKCSIMYTIPAELSMYRSTLKDEPWPEPIEVRQERIERYYKEANLGKWQHIIDATPSIDTVYNTTVDFIKQDLCL